MFHPLLRLTATLTVLLLAMPALATETAAPDTTLVPGDAADTVAPADVPGAAWGVVAGAAGSADDPEPEEKKRVPKKKTRHRDESDSDDDDDDDGSCLSSCFDVFLISMIMSDDDDDDDEETYVAPAQLAEDAEPAPGDTLQGRTYATYVDEPASRTGIEPSGKGLVLDLAWWRARPRDVWDEYKDGGGRISLGGNFLLGRTASLDVDAAFSWAKGYPQFDYETSTLLESPHRTNIYLFDVGVRIGTLHSFGAKTAFLRWGVGPRLYNVKETADLDVYDMPGPSNRRAGEADLSAWKLGGDAVFSMVFDTRSAALVGFTVRYFVIPWEGSREQPLTLDYIGRKPLKGFSIGLTCYFNDLF